MRDDGEKRARHSVDVKLDVDRLVHGNENAHELGRYAELDEYTPEHADLGVACRRCSRLPLLGRFLARAARHPVECLHQVDEERPRLEAVLSALPDHLLDGE